MITILSKKAQDEDNDELIGLTNRMKSYINKAETNIKDKMKTSQSEANSVMKSEMAATEARIKTEFKSEIETMKTAQQELKSDMSKILSLLQANKTEPKPVHIDSSKPE